jgi:ribonuclease P protein subunit POP4
MKITPNIVQHEFIGLETAVVNSSNPAMVGISGRVINETRNTFTIKQDNKMKVIAKDTSIFDFIFTDGTIVEIEGKVIMGRPESRLKKRPRRLW